MKVTLGRKSARGGTVSRIPAKDKNPVLLKALAVALRTLRID